MVGTLAKPYKKLLRSGSVFGRTEFSRICFFGLPVIFRGFCRRIFSFLWRKSAQKNPPGKSPAKTSKICTTRIHDTFLQRGRAAILAQAKPNPPPCGNGWTETDGIGLDFLETAMARRIGILGTALLL